MWFLLSILYSFLLWNYLYVFKGVVASNEIKQKFDLRSADTDNITMQFRKNLKLTKAICYHRVLFMAQFEDDGKTCFRRNFKWKLISTIVEWHYFRYGLYANLHSIFILISSKIIVYDIAFDIKKYREISVGYLVEWIYFVKTFIDIVSIIYNSIPYIFSISCIKENQIEFQS